MQTQNIITTLKIFIPLNTIILTKCIMLKYLTKINLSLYSIIACSLNKDFNNLQDLLSCIIGVTGTKITKQVSLLNNLNLNNYS